MRIVRGAISATLEYQPHDAAGDPADPGASVTVAVTRFDGTPVTTSPVAGAADAPRTTTVAASELTAVDRLDVVWSIDGAEVHREFVHVVGGILATPAKLKALDSSFSNTPDSEIFSAVEAVESLVEQALNRCIHSKLVVDPTWCGTYHSTTRADVRSVVAAYASDGTTIDTTNAVHTMASVQGPRFADGGMVGYVAGMDVPPPDLTQNLALAVRHQLSIRGRDNMPYNAESATLVDGAVVTMARAGVGQSITGNDDVDAAIKRHRFTMAGIA